MTINRTRLLERFLQYVRIDTTAVEDTDRYPSSDGQHILGDLLVQQMKSIGIADAAKDSWGIVTGTVPGNSDAPMIAFNAHLDTSPETTGKNVQPRVIENYDGQDIALGGDSSHTITVAACPELADVKGKTIITTDGTTLLGGDDKAGIALIMELANCLIENSDAPRGPVRVMFTCDEEIGRGVDHVDVDAVGAVACYTFDGGGRDMVDVETFSADLATVTIYGINIHPSIGKDRMVNAIRAAGDLLATLPAEISPERTDGRDGFMHPYTIEGGVDKVVIKILLRDFETSKLGQYADNIREVAEQTATRIAGCTIDVAVRQQYRNMRDGLVKEPRAAAFAIEAHQRLGRDPQTTIIRGGTDGSRFTELGLPTPNLSSGQHNIHSPLEWACLDEMVDACEVGLEIVRRWSEETQ